MLDSPVQITDVIMVIFNVTGQPERRVSGHPSGELPCYTGLDGKTSLLSEARVSGWAPGL